MFQRQRDKWQLTAEPQKPRDRTFYPVLTITVSLIHDKENKGDCHQNTGFTHVQTNSGEEKKITHQS